MNKGFVEFTGEECGGRCLDLHEHYTRYGNLKGAPRMDYLEYIQAFDNLSAVPRTVKKTSSYKMYEQPIHLFHHLMSMQNIKMSRLIQPNIDVAFAYLANNIFFYCVFRYINTLCSYLIDFYYRAFPLVDLDAVSF